MTDDSSIVQRPREYYDVAKLQLQSEFERFLDDPTTQALEAVKFGAWCFVNVSELANRHHCLSELLADLQARLASPATTGV
jgi:hypothetical protein